MRRSAAIGKHPVNPDSLRQFRASLAEEYAVIDGMADLRRAMGIG